MKKNGGFVCFGEINTPIERLNLKHDEALAALAPLGYELRDGGLVIDDEKYETADAAVAALHGFDMSCLIVCVAGWVPTHAVIRVTDHFRHIPMLLWGLCGWVENGRIITTAEQAGTTAIRHTFEALDYSFKYIHNTIGKPFPLEKIDAFVSACAARRALRSARVGTMGYRDMLLYGTQFEGNSMRGKLGVEVEFQEAAWDSLLIGIDTGRFDTVINSVSITDERAEKYDFSDPYYYEARRVVVRADNDSINGPEDLNGKKIATNTTNAFIPWYEENGAEVVGIDTSAEAIDLVLSGRADFLGISVPVLNAYLDEHPDAVDKLKAAFVIPNSEDVIAIPVRKGEPEFLDAINAALAELREEGTLKEISEKYLGGDYTNSAYSN